MTHQQLESVLDLILNQAEFKDLEVITEALQRRSRDLNSLGSLGFSTDSLVKNITDQVGSQMDQTRQAMGQMVRKYVTDMIRQQVPEIPEEHLQALLTEWVPTPEQKASRPAPTPPPLPADAGLAMVRDFIAFSEDRMAPSKQGALRDQVGDQWPQVFWDKFPERVRKLIHVYLKGKLEGEVFWDEVRATFQGERN